MLLWLTYAVPPTPYLSLSGFASLELDSNLCVRKVRRHYSFGDLCWLFHGGETEMQGRRGRLEGRSDVLILHVFHRVAGHVGLDAVKRL